MINDLIKENMNISPYAYPGLIEYPYNSKNTIETEYIINIVCQEFKVTPNDIKTICRKRRFVTPRQMCMYIIRNRRSDLSLKDIGNIFSSRDHTTVIHSIDTIKNDIRKIDRIRSSYNNINIILSTKHDD